MIFKICQKMEKIDDFESKMSDYQIIKKVGKGAFGNVFMAKDKRTNETVAIKEIKVSSSDRKNMQGIVQEVRILCSVEHKNVVSYKGSFWHPKNDLMFIVMEYCGGGDLQNKIQKMKRDKISIPESKAWSYFVQMLNGLKVLHELQIIHRDIKSANVFLTEDYETIKLGDMNVSKITKRDFAQTQVGTPLYISPEIWQGKVYDYKTDIWSLGCLLYEMCTLNYPFLGMDMNSLKRSVLRGRYAPIPSYYSNEMSRIIKLCLQLNPKSRPTAEELLADPFIQKIAKRDHEMTMMNIGKVDQQLIDTIKVPWDFRKLRLPAKKPSSLKRSNSVSGTRPRSMHSRRDSADSSKNTESSKQSDNTKQVDSSKRPGTPKKISGIRASIPKKEPSHFNLPPVDKNKRKRPPITPPVGPPRRNSRGNESGERISSRPSSREGSRGRMPYNDPYLNYVREKHRKDSSKRSQQNLPRAPSAGGRVRPGYENRPKWWG